MKLKAFNQSVVGKLPGRTDMLLSLGSRLQPPVATSSILLFCSNLCMLVKVKQVTSDNTIVINVKMTTQVIIALMSHSVRLLRAMRPTLSHHSNADQVCNKTA